jgi:LysM repeat protein
MDETNVTRQRRKNSARARQMARRQRRSSISTRTQEPRESLRNALRMVAPGNMGWWRDVAGRVVWLLRDAWWYISHNGKLMRWAAAFMVVALVIYFISYGFSGRIFPNVSAMGVGLGGKSVDEAATTLMTYWNNEFEIGLYISGELHHSVDPAQLGMTLDAESTASAARGAGLSGIPFGHRVAPVVEFNYLDAQSYLLGLTETINTPPQNATYTWHNGEVTGVEGQSGITLDVTLTLEWLVQSVEDVASNGRLDLHVTTLPPDVIDPMPYMAQVQERVNQPFELVGFDPFTNTHVTWPISPEIYVRWLEAGPVLLSLREDAFIPYVEQLNATLNTNGDNLRYIAPDEAMSFMREAIAADEAVVNLRVRYRPTTYTVERGDTAMAIARRTGIPFFLIEEANSGRDLNILSVGDVLQVPSRDVTMEHPPVVNKRIVVNLNEQTLVAFENGQPIFRWDISSGVPNAVTSPGIYQILSHDRVATGSSSTLCDSAGLVCGTWEMNWFMGIYEVLPGLVNGFHGSVLLPNGNLLGGGTVGRPATFGCVMSTDENAQLLYEWAEIGTVVEIISNEYLPMSDIGWAVWNSEI